MLGPSIGMIRSCTVDTSTESCGSVVIREELW